MIFEGHIQDGRIVLDEPVELPEGTKVRLEVVTEDAKHVVGKSSATGSETFFDRFERMIGAAENLPPDASTELDHYLYGLSKRQS